MFDTKLQKNVKDIYLKKTKNLWILAKEGVDFQDSQNKLSCIHFLPKIHVLH